MILGNTDSVAENLYYLLWIKDAGLKVKNKDIYVSLSLVRNTFRFILSFHGIHFS